MLIALPTGDFIDVSRVVLAIHPDERCGDSEACYFHVWMAGDGEPYCVRDQENAVVLGNALRERVVRDAPGQLSAQPV